MNENMSILFADDVADGVTPPDHLTLELELTVPEPADEMKVAVKPPVAPDLTNKVMPLPELALGGGRVKVQFALRVVD